jgi:hypothetical protein
VSIRLRASVPASCDPGTVWTQLTDWAGQGRWIPLTTVKTVTERELGVGVRVVALSGLWVGRLPLGLLDRFVVTGWTPPSTGSFGELEVLHLGPFFTGEGAFRVEAAGAGTRITATEMFSLPGGRPVEAVVRLLLPIMRRGFAASLASLAQLSEQSTRQRPT